MRPEAADGLARFASAIHAEGAKAAIQIGHAGWFADPKATGTRPLGPSGTFSLHAQRFARAMSDGVYDPEDQHCREDAEDTANGDEVQEGCHNAIVSLKDGDHEIISVGAVTTVTAAIEIFAHRQERCVRNELVEVGQWLFVSDLELVIVHGSRAQRLDG